MDRRSFFAALSTLFVSSRCHPRRRRPRDDHWELTVRYQVTPEGGIRLLANESD